MTTLFGPILATALLAQIQGGTIQGRVVDDQGKPVAGAQVVFFAPPPSKARSIQSKCGRIRMPEGNSVSPLLRWDGLR